MRPHAVAGGEEKPPAYPLLFRPADLVLVNKVDLLPHLHFDLEKFLRNPDAANFGAERALTSVATGGGVDE